MKSNSIPTPESLSNDDLLATTHDLVRRSCTVEADLLAHLGEIDDRRLYAERAHESMFAFCVAELGFSDGAAFNRIAIARAARRFPAIIGSVRSRSVHLAGLRVLLPHLTDANHGRLLALAGGKTKREIELMMARLAPRRRRATGIRGLPQRAPSPRAAVADRAPDAGARGAPDGAIKIEFTASAEFYGKLREAQALLRNRIPSGDVAEVLGAALDALVEKAMKQHLAVGPKSPGARKRAGTKHASGAKQTTATSETKQASGAKNRGPPRLAHQWAEQLHGRQVMKRARPRRLAPGRATSRAPKEPAAATRSRPRRPSRARRNGRPG